MTTLQQFIDDKFVQKYKSKENVKVIDIDEYFSRMFKEIKNKEVEGGELDLSEYINLENVKINSGVLRSSLTKLVLTNNSKLKTLTILNSFDLVSVDISGCSELRGMIINNSALTDLDLHKEVKITGWEDAQLLNLTLHDSLRKNIEEIEKANQTVEVAPNNNCNIL